MLYHANEFCHAVHSVPFRCSSLTSLPGPSHHCSSVLYTHYDVYSHVLRDENHLLTLDLSQCLIPQYHSRYAGSQPPQTPAVETAFSQNKVFCPSPASGAQSPHGGQRPPDLIIFQLCHRDRVVVSCKFLRPHHHLLDDVIYWRLRKTRFLPVAMTSSLLSP
jgi:hypothetical protein